LVVSYSFPNFSVHSKSRYADILDKPNSIIVAVTGFSSTEKANCTLLREKYGSQYNPTDSTKGLDQYIKNRIDEGAFGFLKQTLDFKLTLLHLYVSP